MPTPDDLSPEDQIVFWIGSIALLDVAIESELRNVWISLVGGHSSASTRIQPDRFATVLSDIRRMLEDPRVLLEDPDAVRQLIAEVGDVHAQRNELAHNAFMIDSTGVMRAGGSAHRTPRSKRTWTAEKSKALSVRARRVMIRVHALAELKPGINIDHDGLLPREWCWAVVRDNFKMNDAGGITV